MMFGCREGCFVHDLFNCLLVSMLACLVGMLKMHWSSSSIKSDQILLILMVHGNGLPGCMGS